MLTEPAPPDFQDGASRVRSDPRSSRLTLHDATGRPDQCSRLSVDRAVSRPDRDGCAAEQFPHIVPLPSGAGPFIFARRRPAMTVLRARNFQCPSHADRRAPPEETRVASPRKSDRRFCFESSEHKQLKGIFILARSHGRTVATAAFSTMVAIATASSSFSEITPLLPDPKAIGDALLAERQSTHSRNSVFAAADIVTTISRRW